MNEAVHAFEQCTAVGDKFHETSSVVYGCGWLSMFCWF